MSIQDSNLGLNPSNDGITVRLAFPPLTEERRKEFVKLVKAKAEDGRTAVRGARRDARKDLEALEKGGDISTDDLRRAEAELDKHDQDPRGRDRRGARREDRRADGRMTAA